ncbi:hypothetical protein [Helicobacter pylori]
MWGKGGKEGYGLEHIY